MPEKDGPTCLGSEEADAVTGPPVAMSREASFGNVRVSSGFFFEVKTPSLNSTSSGCVSHTRAARLIIWSRTSSAALMTAMPVAKAVRLPPVTPVYPTESVSPTEGCTSSAARPKTSAACMARAGREPPMSTEPVTSVIEPLGVTLIVAEEFIPALPQ